MRLYSCKVRLSGSLYNEVPKADVTAAEVTILRLIHGDDAVADLRETAVKAMTPGDSGDKPHARTQSEERDRLIELYGGGLVAHQLAKTPDAAFAAVFGVGGRLPEDIPGTPKASVPLVKPAPAPEPEEDPDNPEDPEMPENPEE